MGQGFGGMNIIQSDAVEGGFVLGFKDSQGKNQSISIANNETTNFRLTRMSQARVPFFRCGELVDAIWTDVDLKGNGKKYEAKVLKVCDKTGSIEVEWTQGKKISKL